MVINVLVISVISGNKDDELRDPCAVLAWDTPEASLLEAWTPSLPTHSPIAHV